MGSAVNVALLGRTHWLLDAGRRLLEAGARVPLVVTFAAEDYYRAGAADFEAFARDAGAAFMLSPDLDDPSIQEALARAGCPVAASVNVPRVLHKPVLNCFELGVLNAHAGNLPRYRGNAAPNWAILMGEARVGLSVHLMEAGQLDSGAVVNKTFFELDDSADITAVYAWLDQEIPVQLADAAIA
ncbi:MAG: hypothetical protein HKO62_10985, partial [Gammaproteobacteria bacterium]|nr:hypothetical protein [Gammaproteobacteria bacterium]